MPKEEAALSCFDRVVIHRHPALPDGSVDMFLVGGTFKYASQY
jgi:hypothetical protein